MAQKQASDMAGKTILAGLAGISQFFANLEQGLLELYELHADDSIKRDMHELAIRQMPFTDKIDELSKASSMIQDPTERAKFQKLIADLEKEGMRAKQGLDEVRRYIRKSGLDKQDKEYLLKEISRCETSMKDLYVANVPAYSYKNVMKLVNQNDYLGSVVPMSLSNGNYLLFYPAEFAEEMEKVMEAAALMYEQHPSVEQVYKEAMMTESQIIRFENISPELAEMAVLESGKYGFINMAKEERADGSGNYDLICTSGATQTEKDRNFREAIEIIVKSAFAVSGPDREICAKKLRHSANEFHDLEEGLKGSGYVFSIHTQDQEIGGKREQMIDVKNFVRFSQEMYRSYHNGVAEKMVVHHSEYDERYASMLYSACQSGTGQKVYLSEVRMAELKEQAKQLFERYGQELEELNSAGRLNMMEKLISSDMDLIGERTRYAKEKNTTMQQAVAVQLEENKILEETIAAAGNGPITEGILLERVVAQELDKHRFRYYTKDKDLAQAAKNVRQAANYCIRESRREAAEFTRNHLPSGVLGGTRSVTPVRWEYLKLEMERINPEDYISHLFDAAVPDPENGEPAPEGKITVSEVRKTSDTLNREFDQAADRAKDLLKDIKIWMHDSPTIDFEESHRYSELNHTRYQILVGQMDERITGRKPERNERTDHEMPAAGHRREQEKEH